MLNAKKKVDLTVSLVTHSLILCFRTYSYDLHKLYIVPVVYKIFIVITF